MAKVVDHCCMVVTKKQNQAVIDKVLKSLGVTNVVLPKSFRDVTELATQEMPHVFLLESDLPDSGTMLILKKLKEDPLFDKAIFVVVRKFSREEILQCVELKVTAMLQQPLDPAALQKKLKALLLAQKGQSPYRHDAVRLPGGASASIKIPGRITGVEGDFFTVESGVIVPSGKQVSLRPTDRELPPIRVTSAGETAGDPSKPTLRNLLFSFDSASGKGREWLLKLKSAEPPSTEKRHVLLYESQADRSEQFKQMLSFYEIEATTVSSFEKLRMTHEAQKSKYRVVYLCEPPLHASGISWEKYANGLPANSRPTQVVATTSQSPRPKPNVVWMNMPFGLDALVERFEAAFVSGAASASASSKAGSQAGSDIDLNISYFGDVISIDEEGALIDTPNDLPLNARINLTHPGLALIDLSKNVRVAATKKMDAAGAKFRARLSNQEGRYSKGLYWKKIGDKISPVLLEEPAPKANPDTPKKSA